MGDTISVLKDITVYGGIILFVFWQWTNRNKYKWRNDLEVPLKPPNWVFPVAWTILFSLISAAWIVVLYTGNSTVYLPEYYIVFYVFMVINVLLTKLWSYVAFDKNRPRVAFAIIMLLDASAIIVLVMIILVESWTALGLYIPYIVWISLATYLNGYYAFYINEYMVISLSDEKKHFVTGKVVPVPFV